MQTLKKYWLGLLILILIVISGYFLYLKLNPKKLPPNLIMGTGRIDGDLINVNTKYSGRIKELFIEEGDFVKKGQLIAVLSSEEYENQLQSIESQIDAKNKEIESKKLEFKMAKESLPEDVNKARFSIESSKAMLLEIESNIKSMEKVVKQDEEDCKRYKNLTERGLFPKEKFEKIKLKYETDGDQLEALKEKRRQILALINTSESNLIQAMATLKNIEILQNAILALESNVKALQAQAQQIRTILNEMKIISPVDGYVVDKVANKGEVVGSGMTIATVVDQKDLYLKMFVDTIYTGKIKIGDKAVIFLDAYPDKPIEATVVKISKKAEFTPKDVAVREDRIQRVYAVHIKPNRPNSLLKIGLPAIGVISIDGKNFPKSLDELPEL